MKRENINKSKKNLSRKILIGFGSLIVLVVLAGGIYWFSLPLEARNMIMFMVKSTESYDDYEEYQVVERNEETLKLSKIDLNNILEGSESVKIGTVTEMVKNEESSMLKKGMVQIAGIENYTGWQFLADEGAKEGEYPFGPSPLSYYTAGIATDLHTQLVKAAEIEGAILDDITVEVINDFYWDEMMNDEGVGHLGKSSVNINIESSESIEVVERIKDIAIKGWALGEALMNETPVIPNLVIGDEGWDRYGASQGTSLSEISYDGDIIMSSVTENVIYPEFSSLLEEKESNILLNLDAMNNMKFQIYAIAKNENNPTRPYYQNVTISTPSGETWELYADEFMGENDKPLATTPLEYFTVGTSLCLTSQTTLVGAMKDLDITDYRVEHLFEYTKSDIKNNELMGSLDNVQTYVFVDSEESKETLENFFNKSLALCFAGEGILNETDMNIKFYLNKKLIEE